MKPLTKTSVTPELLEAWAEQDHAGPSTGAGACCLSHQVKAMQPKPRSHMRLRKSRVLPVEHLGVAGVQPLVEA
ncbi:MAG: hypothetical protein ABIY70_28275 [Capsulimonas sp.]|uniref:hypothetical protein n=1 Tax=Capsulimonas sp. TaxID=2494211 RepID=UPI0032634FF9